MTDDTRRAEELYSELFTGDSRGLSRQFVTAVITAALRAAQDEGLETAAKVADEEFAKRFARGESGELDAEIQHHKAITANTIAAAIRSKKSKGGE